jgi:ADP-heptose:LPS heptosyltransferase
VLNQWDLLAPIDPAFAAPPDPDRDRLEMPVDPAARDRMTARLGALGLGADDEVVVIHGSAGNAFRRWPAASFAAVAGALAGDRADRRVLVLGSSADEPVVRAIVNAAGESTRQNEVRVVAAIGWPLEEVRALMDRAALFVGGDSGPMHVAAAADVPIVALFGPTTAETWAPWRPARLPLAAIDNGPLPCRPCDQRVCEPGDFRCLTRIEPGTVVTAARRLLESAR